MGTLMQWCTWLLCMLVCAHAMQKPLHIHNDSNVLSWSEDFSAGYVQVRPGAHMFWLMEPCRHCGHLIQEQRPWILWLQGGPGASGSGYGNFEEVGPYTAPYWFSRARTWANLADLVFVDNPVGTGFSYVENSTLYAKNNEEIVQDLMMWLGALLKEHPRLARAPMYIFCESYGGKMGLGLAQAIVHAQEAGKLDINLRTLALGDSWVSPMHFVRSWGPLLRAWSLLDDNGVALLADLADQADAAMHKGNGTHATVLWGQIEELVGNLTDHVDWYNMRKHNTGDDDDGGMVQRGPVAGCMASSVCASLLPDAAKRVLARAHPDPLDSFMNGAFRQRMGDRIPAHVKWGEQAGEVFAALAGDFMTPVIDVFDDVLAAGLPVVVYEGQLDLICGTLGFEMWLRESTWKHLPAFQAAHRRSLHAEDGTLTGFVKNHLNLRLYYIMEAGHMVPIDAPEAAFQMVFDLLYGRSAAP